MGLGFDEYAFAIDVDTDFGDVLSAIPLVKQTGGRGWEARTASRGYAIFDSGSVLGA